MKDLALFTSLLLMLATGCSNGIKETNVPVKEETADNSVTAFAERWFSLDLKKQKFGERLETFSNLKPGYADRGLDWFRSTQAFPAAGMNREYGFQSNVLAAVKIYAVNKQTADEVLADFLKISGDKKSKYRVQTEHYEVYYEGLCSPAENSAGRVTITSRAATGAKLL